MKKVFNNKSLILISLLIFSLITTYHLTTVEARSDRAEKVKQMLSDDYEYDLTKAIILKKGSNKPEVVIIEDLVQEEGFISSNVLKDKKEKSSVNSKRKEKLESKLKELLEQKDIEHVQPNYIYNTTAWTRASNLDTPDDFDLTPSASTGDQWYYEKSNLRALWNAQDCFNGGVGCGGSSDVVVAVIDTGLAFEEYTSVWPDIGSTPFDFAPATDMFSGGSINLWSNSGEIGEDKEEDFDDDGNGYIDDAHGVNTENFIYCKYSYCSTAQSGETGHPNDDGGHGTYVTGLIASLVDNSSGSVSPAHNIQIMPIKANFYKSPSFGSLELVEAIDYARKNGADIINLSLAGSAPDTLLEDAINEAYDAGLVIIASSGNSGGSVQYPAKYPNVIAVGAVNANNSRSYYSSYGSELDLVAYVGAGSSQGTATYQQSYTCFTSATDCYESTDINRFNQFSSQYAIGTSFAAPQGAAWAAMVLTNNPTYTNLEIIELMQLNAIDFGAPGRDDFTGWGAVDYSEIFNQVPELNIVNPANIQESAGVYYEITWTDVDDDNDARITFYTDNDNNAFDGSVIHACSNISENDEADSCIADLRHLINGEYHIYGCINDHLNQEVCTYSSGTVSINRTQQKLHGKEAVGSDWKRIDFETPFTEKPVVYASISSTYETGITYLSVRNVTVDGFEIRIRENTMNPNVDDIHRGEMVDWVAVLGSDQDVEVGYFAVDHNWKNINFTRSFINKPKLLSTQQTVNGSHLYHVDLRNSSTTGFEVKLEEPPGMDGIHTFESVGYLAFNEVQDSQSGLVYTTHLWSTVTFPVVFENTPVLIFQINTENGSQHAIPQIKNLTKTGFEFVIAEDPYFQDLVHTEEEVSWLAYDYTGIADSTGLFGVDNTWQNVVFTNIFNSTPLVFAEITSENGGQTVEIDIRDVTNAGFTMRLEEDLVAGWDGIHTIESVNWYAQTPGIINGKEVLKVSIDHYWVELDKSGTYTNPIIFGDIQSENGSHTVAIDFKKVGDSSYIRLEEDIGAGWDGIHTLEDVGIMITDSPTIGCYGKKSIDGFGLWEDTVTFNLDNLGGECSFAEPPKVFVEINSENGGQTVQVDVRNLTKDGFELRLEEERLYDKIHNYEDVVWYAY